MGHFDNPRPWRNAAHHGGRYHGSIPPFAQASPGIDELLQHIEEGVVQVHPIFPAQTRRIKEMFGKYDRMDLADATLVALSEQYPRAKLITIGRTDFTIYRRKDGKPVPCIMPPE